MKNGYWICAFLLVAATLGTSAWYYPNLPERIPTHWSGSGRVDGYGSKATIFIMPSVMAGILLLFWALPWLSPKQFGVGSFEPTYLYIMVVLQGLLAYIYGYIVWSAINGPPEEDRAIFGGIFVLFALMGNVMGKVRRNFWIGIRTPWTLADERVWDATHRFGGRVMVVTGILGFVITIAGWPMVGLGVIIAATLGVVLYSLLYYKRLEKEGAL